MKQRKFERVELDREDTYEIIQFMGKIINMRYEKGITQEKMAELLKTSQSTVSKYESLERIPSYRTMRKMAEIVGGNLLISPEADYTFIVPEKYRNYIKENAKNNKRSINEELSFILTSSLEQTCYIMEFAENIDKIEENTFDLFSGKEELLWKTAA